MMLLLLLLGMIALVAVNVPIALALGVVSVVAVMFTSGFDAVPNMALVLFSGTTKFPLIAIPLFVLAGAIMNASGISHRLIAFASALVGFVRGGLAMVTIGASMFFAEISGSAVADVAALGSILIPEMKAKGYSTPYAAAVMSSSATLAVIIPPMGILEGTTLVSLPWVPARVSQSVIPIGGVLFIVAELMGWDEERRRISSL